MYFVEPSLWLDKVGSNAMIHKLPQRFEFLRGSKHITIHFFR